MPAVIRLADRSAAILNALPDGVLHASGSVVDYVNDAALALLGASREALVGLPLVDALSETERSGFERRLASGGEEGPLAPAFELSFRGAGGTAIPVSAVLRREPGGGCLLLIRAVGVSSSEGNLLAALSEASLGVQRARTREDVLAAARAGLAGVGIEFFAAQLRDDGMELEDAFVRPLLPAGASGGERATGLLSVVRGGRPVCCSDLGALWPPWRRGGGRAEGASSGSPPSAPGDASLAIPAILWPLEVLGSPWGLIALAAPWIARVHLETVALFARHLASALEVAATIEDSERKNHELAAVHAIAAAGAGRGLQSLLQELQQIAAEATASDAGATLYLLDEDGRRLLMAFDSSVPGLNERYRTLPLDTFLAPGATKLEPLASSVARLPEPLRSELTTVGISEVAVLPLHIKGKLAGTLNLSRRRPAPYTPEQLGAAERLCTQIGIQLEATRLHEDIQRRVRLLSVLFDLSRISTEALDVEVLLERVLETIADALALDASAILLAEGDQLRLAGHRGEAPWPRVAALPIDRDTLVGIAALERRSVIPEPASPLPRVTRELVNVQRPQQLAATPLLVQNRLLGILFVGRYGDRPLDVQEIRLLESCAAQVAAAIEHARLFEQERRRVEDLRQFLELGRLIGASLDLAPVLDAAGTALTRLANATHALTFLLERNGKQLRGVAASVPEHREDLARVRIALDSVSIAAEAVRTRAPVRVRDAPGHPLVRQDLAARFRDRGLLALPLLVRGEAIGVVVIGDGARARDWTDLEVERTTVVARQVAIAVANARLYEDLKHSYQQLALTQEQLVARERLAALGELAAVVAHEVRNPLGVLFNSLGSLRRALRPTGDTAMLLDIVEEESDRLNRIVGDLLDFSRPAEPSLHREPLAGALAAAVDAARPAADSARVVIRVDEIRPLPAAPVDTRMLRQALLNLLLNAVQAMPHGGDITVQTDEERRDGHPLAVVTITDTGPGIPDELAERVFQPFFTTKATGTGLGLAVVKRIVEAHRGEIGFVSKPGAGTTFTLRLPV